MRPIPSLLVALAALPAAARPALAAEPPEKAELLAAMAELRQVEMAVELQKRLLPPSPGADMSEAEAGFKALAQQAELSPVQLRPAAGQRVAYADGQPSPVELRPFEISGRDPHQVVDRFLARVASSERLFEMQSLSLKAAPDDTVAFTLRLGIAYCVDPCSGHVEGTVAPRDAALDALVARRSALDAEQAAAQAKGGPGASREAQKAALVEQRAIAERRMYLDQLLVARRAILERRRFHDLIADLDLRYKASRRIVAAIEGFTRALDESALALTELRHDGQTVLQGVTLGAGARQALKPALEAAGFEVASIKTGPSGACQAFTATAKLKPGEPQGDVFLDNGLFDDQAAKACSTPPRPPTARIEAKGAAAGGIHLRARDMDAAELLRLVHEITGQGFVVDPDVTARLSADLEGASLEEAIRALGTAGLVVGPGTLRRVSREGTSQAAPRAATAYTGQPISVSFKAVDLRDLVCLLKSITGTEVWTPRDLEARLTFFAKETPWDQVMDVAAASLGLVFVSEADRAFLGPEAIARAKDHPGAVGPCGPGPAHGRPTRLAQWRTRPPKPEALSVSELKLVALARIAGAWYGYAESYSPLLVSLAPGQAFLDAKVTAVGPTSVSLETAAGKLTRLSLE